MFRFLLVFWKAGQKGNVAQLEANAEGVPMQGRGISIKKGARFLRRLHFNLKQLLSIYWQINVNVDELDLAIMQHRFYHGIFPNLTTQDRLG